MKTFKLLHRFTLSHCYYRTEISNRFTFGSPFFYLHQLTGRGLSALLQWGHQQGHGSHLPLVKAFAPYLPQPPPYKGIKCTEEQYGHKAPRK